MSSRPENIAFRTRATQAAEGLRDGCQWLAVWLAVWLAMALAWGGNCFHACAASDQTTRSAGDSASQASGEQLMQARLGLGGAWKLGHPTPLRIELPGPIRDAAATLEITTVDGEGVPVTYSQPLTRPGDKASPTETGSVWCTITIGRTERPLEIRALDQGGQSLQEVEISGSELGQALPTTQTWMVAVGSAMGVEATSYTLTETGLPNFTTTVISSADQLPTSWRGYAGCDLLIISSSQANGAEPVIAGVDNQQWTAIEQFAMHGGTTILSLGEYAKQLPGDSALRRLIPGEIADFIGNVDTSPLEAATATNFQLAAITATRLQNVRGRVELALLDTASKRMPWWVRHTLGKGVVHYLGSDLDHPVLVQWKDRRLLWDKLLAGFWLREQNLDKASSAEQGEGSSGYLGYDDLIGQLRATLDYFPTTRVFSFGSITAILAVMLLIIGPLDYVISVRWLRRPSLSWIFSGSIIAAASLGLIWLESASRPKQLLLNSAQIVDFLPAQKIFLVDAWSHVYSSRARTIDVNLLSQLPATEPRLDWQGLPGKGLGGMESNLLTDQNLPRYSIELAGEGESDGQGKVAVNGLGIPASGTKCLYATWSGRFEPSAPSQLSELKGIDQIQGLLVNPLPYDIQRPVLVYHNWSYTLPSRLRAGEELTITYDMVPKDLMRRLNRRQVEKTNDILTRWEPEDRQSLDRLLEIMMFYKASGGADYTKLRHRFQPRTDISGPVALDHAVLYGQLAKPLGQVHISSLPEDQVKYESGSTWCRVLLPVTRAEE